MGAAFNAVKFIQEPPNATLARTTTGIARFALRPILRFAGHGTRMNNALDRLAQDLGLAGEANERLRLAFGHACVLRVQHLLEELEVEQCLLGLGAYLAGAASRAQLQAIAAKAKILANHHQGSKSIDGCGHAAVSATYAVAKAIEGNALEAASYAAYAVVYAQGGYAAVAEHESFEPEFAWQLRSLSALAGEAAPHA